MFSEQSLPLDLTFPFLVSLTIMYFVYCYFRGGHCFNTSRLDGKTVIVSGCNTGIGFQTVLNLSKRGARVIMACRNMKLASKAAAEVRNKTMGCVVVYQLDLSSLDSVRECAQEIIECERRIDILINNAGVMFCPFMKTEDGLEMQIGTNHFGHFLFTNLLLEKMIASAPSRIINVSSIAHEFGSIDLNDINYDRRVYSRHGAYCQSKLANVLFTRELAYRLNGTGVTTYALHPGSIKTELGRHIENALGPLKYVVKLLFFPIQVLFMKTSVEGAQTNIYCAVEETLAKESGQYYADCAWKDPAPQAKDDIMARKLWDLSAKMVDL